MKKVTAFKLTNGSLIENEKDALKTQKELDFVKAVNEFADKHGIYGEGKTQLKDVILDNRKELKELLTLID